MEEDKFRHPTDEEDIKRELSKIGDFFVDIPKDKSENAALRFILEIVRWSTVGYYDALGILTDAITELREIMPDAVSREEEEEQIKKNEEEGEEDEGDEEEEL